MIASSIAQENDGENNTKSPNQLKTSNQTKTIDRPTNQGQATYLRVVRLKQTLLRNN